MALTLGQRVLKRTFDIVVATIGLIATGWLILIAYVAATIDTRMNGFFTQVRVGHKGRLFKVIKLRTMWNIAGITTVVTADGDPRITRIGRLLRKTKIDELPQLINVLLGHMSFVGPRPDVPGFADLLEGEDRIVLNVRPGITGPATLAYRKEEELLAAQPDPERYNSEVIFPTKTAINRKYVQEYSFTDDLGYLWQTVFARN